MEREYFFLYLIYGLVFVAMGIYASYKKDKDVNHIPLVRSLKYLGAFGVTHGLSEWVTMVVITGLYDEYYLYMFYIKQTLKAVSFVFLMYFGLSLLVRKVETYLKYVKLLPIVIFLVWCAGIIWLVVKNGAFYHLDSPEFNVVLLRYFMGLPGAMITAWALYLQAVSLAKKKLFLIQIKYKRLATIFFCYGIVDGLFVRKMDFFPASVINNTLFIELFGFPIQFLKIFIGIAINYLLIDVISTFDWEQKEKLKKLEQQRIANEERKKLGLEVHDSIIQNMYAATLKIQFLLSNKASSKMEDQEKAEILHEVKADLGDAIKKTREFISQTTFEQVELRELKSKVRTLVETYNNNSGVAIAVALEDADSLAEGNLSTKSSTNIYYIIQEAINNAAKHSKGSIIRVAMKVYSDKLEFKIIDDGVGLQLDHINPVMHLGMKSMYKRAEDIGAKLTIQERNPGTEVEIIMPWERGNDEKSD
ncbi:sensor histidine kinase [Desulfuribacillus alkaliarsenatis]|uniref:histidine kinase n=1 Tax=Desulfuribacillus alkaliarsenatis TaxID=766136 RepID=A0A1E5G4R5_9FIRM|nr:ATP-binding protein [Desulfuribacillus alkaliarsenatis]OEF98167.1 hypothetical protein BHF68_00305 [Desulfuribacillus alkaliarsenatis]